MINYINLHEGTMCQIPLSYFKNELLPGALMIDGQFFVLEDLKKSKTEKALMTLPQCFHCGEFITRDSYDIHDHNCSVQVVKNCKYCAAVDCTCSNLLNELLPDFSVWMSLSEISDFCIDIITKFKTVYKIITLEGEVELMGALLAHPLSEIRRDSNNKLIYCYKVPKKSYLLKVIDSFPKIRNVGAKFLIDESHYEDVKLFARYSHADRNAARNWIVIEDLLRRAERQNLMNNVESFRTSNAFASDDRVIAYDRHAMKVVEQYFRHSIIERPAHRNFGQVLYIEKYDPPMEVDEKLFEDSVDGDVTNAITGEVSHMGVELVSPSLAREYEKRADEEARMDAFLERELFDPGRHQTKREYVAKHQMETMESEADSTHKVAEEKTEAKPVPQPTVTNPGFIQLFKGFVSDLFEQAIDKTEVGVGVDSSRKMVKVNTPSGPQTAVAMAVNDIANETVDFTLNQPLVEHCKNWCPIVPLPSAATSYRPDFNVRTLLYMAFFQQYRTDMVWKIVAKPPLFQAQRFWVSFQPTIDGTPTDIIDFNDLIGFEWNASEENEIYVVTPWSSTDYMTDTLDFTQNGMLRIDPVTELISEDGLPEPLNISVYAAPLNMELFIPDVIKNPLPADVVENVLTLDLTGDAGFSVSEAGAPIYVGALSFAWTDGGAFNYGTTGLDIIDFDAESPNFILDNILINQGATVFGTNLPSDFTITLYFYSTKSFIITTNRNHNSKIAGLDYNKIPVTGTNIEVSDFPNLLATYKILDLDTSEIFKVTTEGYDNEPLMNINFITGSGSLIEIPLSDPVSFTFPVPMTVNLISSGVPTISNNLEFRREFNAQHQMFGYKYNPSFNKNNQVYGKMTDHTSRLDAQWSKISAQLIANPEDSLTFDILEPQESFANFDRNRHLLFSKNPIVKFTATSNPSTNILLRLTQKNTPDQLTLEQALQLPGMEWDIKSGPMVFQPYWTGQYPADYATVETSSTTVPVYIQVDVLGGTVGTTFELVAWYNTKTLDYHHMLGPEPSLDSRRKTFNAKHQMDSLTHESHAVKQDPDSGASVTENRWNYVTSFPVPAETGAVVIPVDSRAFGKWVQRHAGRFSKWRGELQLKFMINNSFLVNANYHFIHINEDLSTLVGPLNFEDILSYIPHSVSGAPGSATELCCQWRRPEPFLSTEPTEDSNGFVVIVIPLIASSPTNPLESIVTVYADATALEFSLPRSTTFGGTDLSLDPIFVPRTST